MKRRRIKANRIIAARAAYVIHMHKVWHGESRQAVVWFERAMDAYMGRTFEDFQRRVMRPAERAHKGGRL